MEGQEGPPPRTWKSSSSLGFCPRLSSTPRSCTTLKVPVLLVSWAWKAARQASISSCVSNISVFLVDGGGGLGCERMSAYLCIAWVWMNVFSVHIDFFHCCGYSRHGVLGHACLRDSQKRHRRPPQRRKRKRRKRETDFNFEVHASTPHPTSRPILNQPHPRTPPTPTAQQDPRAEQEDTAATRQGAGRFSFLPTRIQASGGDSIIHIRAQLSPSPPYAPIHAQH